MYLFASRGILHISFSLFKSIINHAKHFSRKNSTFMHTLILQKRNKHLKNPLICLDKTVHIVQYSEENVVLLFH